MVKISVLLIERNENDGGRGNGTSRGAGLDHDLNNAFHTARQVPSAGTQT
jgi:hypothetical protein